MAFLHGCVARLLAEINGSKYKILESPSSIEDFACWSFYLKVMAIQIAEKNTINTS